VKFRSLFLTFLAFGTVAAAAPVTYTFSGSFSTFSESFTFTAPDFITTGTRVTPAQTTSCVSCGTGFLFNPSIQISVFPDVPLASVIGFDAQPTGTPGVQVAPNYVFALGTFSELGTHQSFIPPTFPQSGTGTLTVSLAQTAAPEPASIEMMACAALIGLIAIQRSKKSGTRIPMA
jgi:hypothetical protein